MSIATHLPHPRDLVRFGPHNDSHAVAVRAGISVAAPLFTLTATGHAGWAVYAAFGAFVSLYGRMHGHRHRLHTQLAASAVLVAAVTLGAAIASIPATGILRAAVLVLGCAAMATVASVVGDLTRWHPVGPLFAVFAVATCAETHGSGRDILTACAVAAASAMFATAIGQAGRLSRRRRMRPRALAQVGGLTELREPPVMRHALRYGGAIVVAGALATSVGIGHPGWAMVAAVVPLSVPDTPTRLLRAAHRVVGTLLGIVVAAGLLHLRLGGWELIALIVALQVVTELFVGRNYGFAMLFITPMALLMSTVAGHVDVGPLLRDRAVQTVIGAAVGITIALLSSEHRASVVAARAEPSAPAPASAPPLTQGARAT
ncbi:FUSC family protein [Cellulomonas timonensis]|uniref:FUSC family protein n=1 Tax=Cellulomonas timonensis TaxID=1689271 RepID=UPI00083528A7|nr:FUSC family protein [Cellulomonas timonensis]